ncbi:unnamed protein product [Symbiodinium sp. KB8]|nr:unnamed protein product [Symbiodinium sp. KB8]
MKTLQALTLCAALVLTASHARGEDAAAGEAQYAETCINCHGKAGKGMASFPSIAGRDADYIAERLMQYRAREMPDANRTGNAAAFPAWVRRRPVLRKTFCAIVASTILAGAFVANAWAAEQTQSNAGTGSEAEVAAPEDGGPRRWQVAVRNGTELRASPAPDAPVIGMLADGAILSNLGCADAGGHVWCKVRPLHSRARGYVVAEVLRPARGPDGTVPMGADDSALRAGQGDFDASGTLSCAQIRGEPMGACAFGVARGTGGDATVVVTFSNGFKRRLFFAHGRFISADATMSGTGFDSDWRMENGLHLIRVDDQRYALPNTAVFGE